MSARRLQQRGALLIAAVVLIAVIGVLASTLSFLQVGSTTSGVDHLRSAQALFVAESGLEYAAYQSKVTAAACSSLSYTQSVDLGSFTTTAAANSASSTLDGDISAIATEILLVSKTNFGAHGRITIGSEEINYALISGLQLTGAKRHRMGTTAASYSGGTTAVTQNQCMVTSTGTVGVEKRILQGSMTTLAAVSATHLTTARDTTDAQIYTTASITPSANHLVLAWVVNRHATAADTVTLSSNGLTWVQVNTVTFNGGLARLTLFRAMGASPSAGAVTVTVAGSDNIGAAWSISQYANVDTSGTNGSGAVIQSVTANSVTTADTSLSITLAALGQSINATAGGFSVLLNSATAITPGAGYTELAEATFDTPPTNIQSQWRATGSTTVNVTNTSGVIGGIGVEIAAPPYSREREWGYWREIYP